MTKKCALHEIKINQSPNWSTKKYAHAYAYPMFNTANLAGSPLWYPHIHAYT